MKLSDLISVTEDNIIVCAPAYNKVGTEYKGRTIELGRYCRYNRPPDSIKQATIINVGHYDGDHILVLIDV